MENCLFCRIASGEVLSHQIHSDETLVAFLDTGPIRPGHVQIVPRRHFEVFDDLPSDIANAIVALAQKIAKAQKAVFEVKRVGFLFTGGDIPHAHAHLVPMVENTDLTSRHYIQEQALTFRPLPHPGNDELHSVATALIAALRTS
jgi:histidine triad (HIT) family protein